MSGVEVIVPDGTAKDGVELAVGNWLYAEGDRVTSGAVICELMLEKVTVEIAAPATGRLAVIAQTGSVVQSGELLARISETREKGLG